MVGDVKLLQLSILATTGEDFPAVVLSTRTAWIFWRVDEKPGKSRVVGLSLHFFGFPTAKWNQCWIQFEVVLQGDSVTFDPSAIDGVIVRNHAAIDRMASPPTWTPGHTGWGIEAHSVRREIAGHALLGPAVVGHGVESRCRRMRCIEFFSLSHSIPLVDVV